MRAFFRKLGGRDVTRVAAAYLAVAWLVIEVLVTVSDPLAIPQWVNKAAIISALIGFPIALALAWTYRLTPEGRIEREQDSYMPSPAKIGGRKIDFVIIGALALAVVFLLAEDRFGTDTSDGSLSGGKPVITSVKKLTTSPVYLPPVSSVFPLVMDDSRIYFDHIVDGEVRMGQVARTGGEVLMLERPFVDPGIETRIDRLSSGRATLVLNVYDESDFAKPVELWEMPIVRGSPRKIGVGYQSAVSPDGKTMVFRRDITDLYLANPDMSDERKVFSADAMSIYWLRFSPDGKRVRFTSFKDHFAGSIWEYSLERDVAYPVLPDWEARYACCGSWTPDGKFFVFEADHGEGPQIWAVREMPDGLPDPEGPFRLTSEMMEFKRPTISHDGKTIYAIGWQLRGEIVIKAPGDEDFHSIDTLESMSVEQVDYSADKEWVAYVSYPEGHLWQRNLVRGISTQLTFGPMRAANPATSPDGRMIAFEGWEPGDHTKIYIIDMSGGDSKLISNVEIRSWAPSWSPDSTKLMFSERSDHSPVVYDLLLETITAFVGADPVYGAKWSPDGSKLLGWSSKKLVIYDVENAQYETLLENAPSYAYRWFWSNDSKHIYLVDSWFKGRERSVHKLSIGDGTIQKIIRVGDERTVWGTNERWVGVTPEGAVMFLRDHSIHNIYALEWNPE